MNAINKLCEKGSDRAFTVEEIKSEKKLSKTVPTPTYQCPIFTTSKRDLCIYIVQVRGKLTSPNISNSGNDSVLSLSGGETETSSSSSSSSSSHAAHPLEPASVIKSTEAKLDKNKTKSPVLMLISL